ncbi:MAG: PqqD family protein [Prevotellaceae bacterium]|nr:PqqD family protein [Prevotellaceae bacterium]
MKIKKEFRLHRIGDEHIVIKDGNSNVDFTEIISLNPTAAFLWKEVEGKEFTKAMLADLLTEYYDVERDVAVRDVDKFVDCWLEAGLAE